MVPLFVASGLVGRALCHLPFHLQRFITCRWASASTKDRRSHWSDFWAQKSRSSDAYWVNTAEARVHSCLLSFRAHSCQLWALRDPLTVIRQKWNVLRWVIQWPACVCTSDFHELAWAPPGTWRREQMSCMTILSCLAQPRRPHLGPRIRAALGWKGPSRPSGPNAYQRLQSQLGGMDSSLLEYLGWWGTQCPQEQPELERPQRIISSDPLIIQMETFPKPEKQLVPRSPS